MKALAIGDFHGKCSFSIKKIVKQENIDFILCTGDLSNANKIRNLIFKYWKMLQFGFDLPELVGKREYRKLVDKAIQSQDKVLKKLAETNIPVYLVWGNNDYSRKVLTHEPYKHTSLEKKLKKYKNIKLLQHRIIKYKHYYIIGISGYRGNYLKKKENINKIKNQLKGIKRNNIILLMHEPPFGFMDKVTWKFSPLRGERVGNKQNLKLVRQLRPGFFVFGHMHETQGRKKLNKTILINNGPAFEKQYAILDLKTRRVSFR